MQDINLKVWASSILLAVLMHGIILLSWSENAHVIKKSGESSVSSLKLSFKRTSESELEFQDNVKSEPVNNKLIKPVNRSVSKSDNQLLVKNSDAKKAPKKTVQKTIDKTDSLVEDLISENNILLIKKHRIDYFSQLISHIERFKFYPNSARRRGIEGRVSICFDLNSDGSISDLIVESKYRILKQAAEEAIISALPMPIPLPAHGVSVGRKVDFNMLYAMK